MPWIFVGQYPCISLVNNYVGRGMSNIILIIQEHKILMRDFQLLISRLPPALAFSKANSAKGHYQFLFVVDSASIL